MSAPALNLDVSEGLFERQDRSYGDENYLVYRANAAFSFFWHVTLSVSAMSLAIVKLKSLEVPQGAYIGLTGLGFDYTVRVPAHGALDDVMNLIQTPGMEFTLHHARTPGAQEVWPEELRKWLETIIWPEFIHLFENNRSRLERSRDSSVGLARVLRDAYAHGGRIHNSKHTEDESWAGLTIVRGDHGRPVSDFVGGADLIVLGLKLCSLISRS